MKSVFMTLVSLICSFAFAQTTTSKIESKSDLNRALGNRQFEEDKAITDAKLKADAGSLSQYSMKFRLGYSGPAINDLSSKTQPNMDGGIGVYETALRGSISARYRMDSNSAMSVGTGISALTPFHGIQRVDTNNPYLSYDRTYRAGELQIRNSVGASYVTVPNFRDVGQYAGLDLDSSMIYDFGGSPWSVGLDVGLNYGLYERSYVFTDRRAVQYSVGMLPQVKYTFNDKISMNSTWGIGWWNLRQHDSRNTLWNRTVLQRVGLGWAITRDIYFSPSLAFYPSKMAMDTTNFNLAAIFSVL